MQHGITHREMQVRLRQLDERTRRTTGYAADVVEENDKLNLDKSALLREVEFLQCQVANVLAGWRRGVTLSIFVLQVMSDG